MSVNQTERSQRLKTSAKVDPTSCLTRLSIALKRDFLLYLLLLLPIAYFIIFKYIPMGGIVLAFRRYLPGKSIFGVEWAGLKYFKIFLKDPTFWKVFKNTFVLSFMNLIINYPLPIIFALLLNEVKSVHAKKFVQTVSYLPKFFSIVVVASMIKMVLSPSSGVINTFIEFLGYEKINFLNKPEYFKAIYVISDTWQFMGWNAILYIAALAGVDPQLYEAAAIDGANRWQQTIHVTIAGIMPTINITFILAVGYMLTVGFEKIIMLYTPNIYDTADVLQTFVYRMGLERNNYSYATAVGVFQAIVSLVLLTLTNKIASSTSEYSLW